MMLSVSCGDNENVIDMLQTGGGIVGGDVTSQVGMSGTVDGVVGADAVDGVDDGIVTDSVDGISGSIEIDGIDVSDVEFVCVEGTMCDDGNLCTINDVCVIGLCAGELLGCDDKNVCIKDFCVDGECKNLLDEIMLCVLNFMVIVFLCGVIIMGVGLVVVMGLVMSEVGVVIFVDINGEMMLVDENGQFVIQFMFMLGINFIDVKVIDVIGQ